MKPRTRKTVELLYELKEHRLSNSGRFEDIDEILRSIEKFSGPLPASTAKPIKAKKQATAKPKPLSAPVAELDTAALTDAQLFEHYKRTATLKDVRFFLTHAKPQGDVLTELVVLRDELQTRKARPADGLAYRNLVQAHWTARTDRHTHMPCTCEEPVVSALHEPMWCPACSFRVGPKPRKQKKAA